ncbi:thiamine pyrophosphate-dependent enzyme [Canibacter zhuwentaonis]|uniref:thiamine pyrophosphate-dependent enzyme n=1 Tax=Canibacter zhuwentaonis TaxID=2837491 RepID=UPI0035103500
MLASKLLEMQDPEPIRFLDKNGEWNPSESAAVYAIALEGVTLDDKQQWFSDMSVTRAFDAECTNLQRQGQMALWVPSLGQEGCQVGFAHAADERDYIFPAYREHALAYARGVELYDIGKTFRGISHGGWDPHDPKNGNVHPYTLVLGAQAHHAVGYSLGQMLTEKAKHGDYSLDPGTPGTATDRATIVFYGDGTTSQGDANESMVFAASYQTPTLFIVQNNQWAISVPVARQSRTPIYRRALGFGINAVQIDGNDPLAAYAVAKTMLGMARGGGGPQYIEALTYRIGAHTTSDDPTRYRDSVELDEWRLSDPVNRLAAHLRAAGVGEEFFEQVTQTAREKAQQVREKLLASVAPHPDTMFAHAYASAPHALRDEQRRWMAEYEESYQTDASGEERV